jgi:hypothetical protein
MGAMFDDEGEAEEPAWTAPYFLAEDAMRFECLRMAVEARRGSGDPSVVELAKQFVAFVKGEEKD